MLRFLLAFILALQAFAKEPVYELAGRIEPESHATVSIYGATTPFSQTTLADERGRFRFRKLLAGSYTLAILVPGRGEARVTVDVGPSSANSKGRVVVTLALKDSDFTLADSVRQRNAVSLRQLSIPDRALREFEQAHKDLERRDADSATTHLLKSVEIAPQFSAAWNTLGTIAYQTQQYNRAEECFRQALAQNADSYEALVNLGGVLINLRKLEEARDANERAVSIRPNDALANAQLGMTYFGLGRFEVAEKDLDRAVQIDPGHFSHPQLMLVEIHLRKNEQLQAADDLENFLKHHPDWPQARELRTMIEKLREERK